MPVTLSPQPLWALRNDEEVVYGLQGARFNLMGIWLGGRFTALFKLEANKACSQNFSSSGADVGHSPYIP